jgi:uncharacterized protein YcfL
MRRQRSSSILEIAVLSVAFFFACAMPGCFGGSEPLVVSTPRKGQLLAEGKLRIENVSSSFVGKDIHLDIRITNISAEPVSVELAVKWLDEELKAVAQPAWSTLTIPPAQSVTVESSVSVDRAIHYELLVKVR